MPDVPHLLLVCPRTDVLGKLLGLPVAVTVVHRPGADREQEAAVALQVVDADFQDSEALLEAVREVHRHRPLTAVLGLTELSLLPVSIAGAAVGARGNAPSTVALAQDKASMRRRLQECGLGTVAHRICTRVQDAADFVRGRPGGVVLKPVSGNGGTGVYLLAPGAGPAEVERAWAWTTGAEAAWGWKKEAAEPVEVLAEEFLTGQEFSVEGLSVDGTYHVLAVTRKYTTGPPHFVEIGHDLPAGLPADRHAAVTGAAARALDAIGYAWGPSHTEVMLAPDGRSATVVEINARQGGDQIWELLHLVTGVDLIACSVAALALGVPPWTGNGAVGGAAIRYLTPPPGVVAEVTGLDAALAVDGVIRIGELCAVGDGVDPLGDSWNRGGYVVAAGPDPKAAAAAAEEAAALISIRTEPAS